jgi:hypothetical protein
LSGEVLDALEASIWGGGGRGGATGVEAGADEGGGGGRGGGTGGTSYFTLPTQSGTKTRSDTRQRMRRVSPRTPVMYLGAEAEVEVAQELG